MPPKALVVYFPIAVLANALLATLNRLTPAALLGDLANALDASGYGIRYVVRGSSGRSTGAATVFLWLSSPFVKKRLIEGVYGSSVGMCHSTRCVVGHDKKVSVGGGSARPERRKQHYLHFPLSSMSANCFQFLPRLCVSIGRETVLDRRPWRFDMLGQPQPLVQYFSNESNSVLPCRDRELCSRLS